MFSRDEESTPPNSVSQSTTSLYSPQSSIPLVQLHPSNEGNFADFSESSFLTTSRSTPRNLEHSERLSHLPSISSSRKLVSSSPSNDNEKYSRMTGFWERVPIAVSSSMLPCQRSLHAAAVWRNLFLVFGGYDGEFRVNDLHAYNFTTHQWHRLVSASGATSPPSARDRHITAVCENSLYVFGGFDGYTRVAGIRY